MTVTLRDAVPDDAPILAAILRAWLDETPWMPQLHTPDEDRVFLRNLIRTQRVRVAVSASNTPLGFLAMDRGLIEAIYVSPQARRFGVGALLLHDAKQTETHLTCWCFQANQAAQRFYLGQGFVIARETEGELNEEGLPDLCFVWSRPKEAQG